MKHFELIILICAVIELIIGWLADDISAVKVFSSSALCMTIIIFLEVRRR